MRTRVLVRRACVVGLVAACAATAATAPSVATTRSSSVTASSGCRLDSKGNRIKHLIYFQFDNTHLMRDGKSIASDLQQMPHLKNFITSQGTLLDNDHTILIAHTAGGILSSLTGLYPDRNGQAVSNSYDFYQPNGVPTFTSSFKYWNDPVDIFNNPPQDALPNMVNGDSGSPKETPAPWVPFTRAGCNVGGVGAANIELENTSTSPTGDMSTVFGQGSPEWNEANNPATAAKAQTDFVGIAIHCGDGSAMCHDATGVRPDKLPDEPGGYSGFKALFGAKYVNPAITGGGTTVHDMFGNPIQDSAGNPGFPGFDGMSAAVSLGYVAQMQEHGVPITYAYISDAHDNHSSDTAFGPGEAGYVAQLKSYDQAFKAFFQRLANHGINRSNTLFVFTVDEGDHFTGLIPKGCDGTTTPCTYTHAFWKPGMALPSNQIGEVNANITKVVPNPKSLGYDIHFDSAPTFYINGQPGRTNGRLRQFERLVGKSRAIDPYLSTSKSTPITRNLIDTVGERALHMINADPLRTPSFTLFANPDFFFQTFDPACGAPVCVDYHFAWNHGDDAPEIARTWAGFVGPGVVNRGQTGFVWSDHTDVRPTILSLLGLHDDYTDDGTVLPIESGTAQPAGIAANARAYRTTAAWYTRVNAPFAHFGQDVLTADTRAVRSGSASSDHTYTRISDALQSLTTDRNALVDSMRSALNNAAFNGVAIGSHQARLFAERAEAILNRADRLAGR